MPGLKVPFESINSLQSVHTLVTHLSVLTGSHSTLSSKGTVKSTGFTVAHLLGDDGDTKISICQYSLGQDFDYIIPEQPESKVFLSQSSFEGAD